ncbi:MAG: hypothetical protein EP333_09070 [Bacteroidetes bacterium]|nr:MAG: hypothetical protein EP333_09070 [Bacteroidota bacterium]TNE96076.1 MAG: hypothetical protein EP322_08910 [Bacteroidota bacterium]
MREELKGPKVENVGVAVIQTINELNEKEYNAYLLNLRDDIMEGIIITSKGYGENTNTGEKVRTSTLRHSLEVLLPNEAAKIEPIMEEVFGLSNEYWVSFWVNDVMYDKKFVFLAESISEKNMKEIPLLGEKGVMIL